MKRLLLALLATATVLIASPVLAQDYGKKTVTGTVVVAGSDSLVVDTATGRMMFKLDSALDRVRYDGLEVGSQIEVTHKVDDQTGRQLVTFVNVVPDPSMTTYDAQQNKAGSQASNTVPGDSYAKADEQRDASNQLPATASPFAALALLSLSAVLAGLVLRAHSKRPRFGRSPITHSL